MDLQGILRVNISIICHNYALRVLLACSLLAVVGICCFKEVKKKRKKGRGTKVLGERRGELNLYTWGTTKLDGSQSLGSD